MPENTAIARTTDDGAVALDVELCREADGYLLRITNSPAQLPGVFDFPAGEGLGAGLRLVRSLLPVPDTDLRIEQRGDGVCAELRIGAHFF